MGRSGRLRRLGRSISSGCSLGLTSGVLRRSRLAGALQAKAEADPTILAGGAGTPAPAVDEASDEPVTETDESADEADGHVGTEDSSAESTESEDPTEA